MIPNLDMQLLKGCQKCGGRFFYFIKKEALQKMQFPKLNEEQVNEIETNIRQIIGQKKVKHRLQNRRCNFQN